MELNDEQFWRALRHALELAEADEAEQMAAAERMLAEMPADPVAPLSDERIAEAVRYATAPSVAEMEARAHDAAISGDHAEHHDGNGRAAPLAMAPVPAPRLSWRRRLIAALPRPLAAAAAILLAPQFLAAATVVTVAVVVTAVVLRNTTQTLSYQDAVRLMMHDEQSEQTRATSQSVVFSHLKESIELVQVVATEGSPVGTAASTVVDDLRGLLGTGAPFVLRDLPDPHLELGDVLSDATQDASVRKDALQKLAEQVSYGLSALKAVEQAASAPPKVKLENAIWLAKLASTLAK